MKHTSFLAWTATILAAGTLPAGALQIRVSQESAPGAGDFDANVLGSIVEDTTAGTVSSYYSYGNPDAFSYNGSIPTISNTTQMFFVDGSDGLSLFIVHDAANDGSGGSANTRVDLVNAAAANVRVADDPGAESPSPVMGTDFTASHNWASCCTDGYVIGSITGEGWEVYAGFTATPTGIDGFQATNADGANIPLVLESGRRVRFDIAPSRAVPSGGFTIGMLGMSLLTMSLLRRRLRK